MAKPELPILSLALIIIVSIMPVGLVDASPKKVLVVKLEGTISIMSAELLDEALDYAETKDLPVIMVLNTPGGSIDSTFKIIDLIEASRVPVVGYVFPSGAKAWSAGTYILLSTHVAAMAPFTIIGSGQPVMLFYGGSEPITDTKTINALTAYLAERARMHGRNETAAELFIKENLNLNDEKAMEYGVVEVTAASLPELLEKIDGLKVTTAQGEYTINSMEADVLNWSPSLRILVLKAFSEPMIALLMLTIGIYALLFGLSTPGFGAEVVGSILLVLGLMGVGMIRNINIGGLILIILGAILLFAELFIPGFGIVGGAGIVSTLIGSLLLFPREWMVSEAWLNTLYYVSIIIPLFLGGFFIFTTYKVIQARRRPPLPMGFVGGEGEVVEEITPEKEGFILYRGEYWKAKSSEPLKPKQTVIITRKEGPILIVQAKETEEK